MVRYFLLGTVAVSKGRNTYLHKRLLTAGFTAVLTIANVAYGLGKSGFYAGAEVGLDQDLVNYGPITASADASMRLGLSHNLSLYRTAGLLGVFGGYHASFKHVFADFELSSHLGSHHLNTALTAETPVEDETLTADTTTRINSWDPSFDFHLGAHLYKDATLYVILGTTYTREKLVSDSTAADTAGGDTTSATVSLKTGATVLGFRVGLGLQQPLSENTSLRLSYVFTKFHDLTASGTAEGDSAPMTLTHSVTTTFKNQAIMLGVLYSFA